MICRHMIDTAFQGSEGADIGLDTNPRTRLKESGIEGQFPH
jgi:hypothetical protein